MFISVWDEDSGDWDLLLLVFDWDLGMPLWRVEFDAHLGCEILLCIFDVDFDLELVLL